MRFFEDLIKEVHTLVDSRRAGGLVRDRHAETAACWPRSERGDIVMQAETAIELGHPETLSSAFHLWSNEAGQVEDGRITLIGPDLAETQAGRLPFGKVVLLQVEGFNEDNCYDRHAVIGRLRFDLAMAGYMMRAVSQAGREWSRVSRQALQEGFSLLTLGNELVHAYRAHDHVKAVEVLLVTASKDDVRALEDIALRSERMIQALNKMANEMDFDCDSCDYTDVCDEADSLRSMRSKLKKEKVDGGQQ